MISAALALSLRREGKADAKQLSLVEILFRCSRHPQHDYLLTILLTCAFSPCVNDSTLLYEFFDSSSSSTNYPWHNPRITMSIVLIPGTFRINSTPFSASARRHSTFGYIVFADELKI
jgi:hypothetical protein